MDITGLALILITLMLTIICAGTAAYMFRVSREAHRATKDAEAAIKTVREIKDKLAAQESKASKAETDAEKIDRLRRDRLETQRAAMMAYKSSGGLHFENAPREDVTDEDD